MQEGGTVGIPEGVNVHNFLPIYAASDFNHDFGHAKLSQNFLNSIETTGDRSKFIPLFQKLIAGKGESPNAAAVFGSKFNETLPRDAPRGVQAMNEDKLLEEFGFPYSSIMQSVTETKKAYGSLGTRTVTMKEGLTRNYNISFASEKGEWEGKREYTNLVSCMWALSNPDITQRKKKFAIMYDAGVCKTSDIGSDAYRTISKISGEAGEFPNDIYEVYFINSSENMTDPAPKIDDRTFRKIAPNIKIFFLKDTSYVGQYTSYDERKPGDQRSDVYSKYTITTTRSGNDAKIRATVEFGDKTSIQMDDMKRESEIDASALNAVSAYLKNGGNIDTKVMSSFFLKRAGDWCQALCLLDKSRTYTVTQHGVAGESKTTLQQLEDNGTEIMLMTHDRVLLAFALTLGVNIMYTNNRDRNHWMVYLQNADVFRIDDVSGLQTLASELIARLKRAQELSTNVVNSVATAFKDGILWDVPSVLSKIALLRKGFSILTNIPKPSAIKTQEDALDAVITELRSTIINSLLQRNFLTADKVPQPEQVEAKRASEVLAKLRNMIPNVLAMINLVEKVSSPEFKYPDQDDEAQTIVDFAWLESKQKNFKQSHKLDDKRTINLEASFALIAERLADDMYTVQKDVTFEHESIMNTFPSDTEVDAQIAVKLGKPSRVVSGIYRSLLEVFSKTIRLKVKRLEEQFGGGPLSADTYFLPQAIYLMTKTTIPTVYDDAGFAFEIGKKMIDYDSREYTVIDDYIVTMEMKPTLLGALNTLHQFSTVPEYRPMYEIGLKLKYTEIIILRLLLLMVDQLDNEWKIVDSMSKEDQFADELLVETARLIAAKMVGLMSAVEAFKSSNFPQLFTILLQVENLTIGDAEQVVTEAPEGIQSRYIAGSQMIRSYIAQTYPKDWTTALRNAERRIATNELDDKSNVMIFDINTGVSTPIDYLSQNAKAGESGLWTFGISPLGDGNTSYQSIATGVIVPRIPQPDGRAIRGGRRPLYSLRVEKIVNPSATRPQTKRSNLGRKRSKRTLRHRRKQ